MGDTIDPRVEAAVLWLNERATVDEQLAHNYQAAGNGMGDLKAFNAKRARAAAAALRAQQTRIAELEAALKFGLACRLKPGSGWRISGAPNVTAPHLLAFEQRARALLGLPPAPDPLPMTDEQVAEARAALKEHPTPRAGGGDER